MKSRNTRTPLLAIAALALLALVVLCPRTGEALENLPGQMWIVTPEAQARTDANQCGSSNQICKELCYYGAPQGEFYCFFNH